MEGASLIFQTLSVVDQISSAESHKVFNSLWHNISEKVNDNISGSSASDVNAESDLVGGSFLSGKGCTDSSLANATATRSSRTKFFIINNNTSYLLVHMLFKQTKI